MTRSARRRARPGRFKVINDAWFTLIETLIVVAIIGIIAASASPELRGAAQQQFRTGVDLIEVDVSVVDGRGRPVEDLRAPEFHVTVDGEPREVVSAQFIGLEADPDMSPVTAPVEVFYSSNEVPDRGRLIILAVDRENISFGEGANVTQAASRFLETLVANDRVGLIAVPQPGPYVDLTPNHALVQDAIDGMVGVRQPLQLRFNIGIAEAFAIANMDNRLMAQEVIFRLCGVEALTPEYAECKNAVESDASRIVYELRRQTDQSLRQLVAIIRALREVEGPKHIIWISSGLPLDGPGAGIQPIAQLAAAARVTINVLMLDEPLADASTIEPSRTSRQDRARQEQGLQLLAGITGGALRRVGPNADAVFERLAAEMSGYYLLGVEALRSDQDGEAHQIDVSVERRGTTVRTHREFVLAAPNAEASTEDVEARVQRTLRTPFAVSELPLRVTTYAFQAPDPTKVRLVVVAEIEGSELQAQDATLGYTLTDENGGVAASGLSHVTLDEIEQPDGLLHRFSAFVIVEPGSYRLKLAVIDADRRRGSVEHLVQAWQLADLPFATSDLVVADATAQPDSVLRPPVEAQLSSGQLAVYTELYADTPSAFDDMQVLLEVTKEESGPPRWSAAGVPQAGNHPNSRTVSAVLPVDALPPGRYLARAVVLRGDERLAHLTRPFRIAAAAGVASSAAPAAAGDAASRTETVPSLGSLLDKPPEFQQQDVLVPDVINFFMDRLDQGRPAVHAMTSRVRTGNLEGVGRLAFETGDQMAAAFLGGLELLGRQQLDQAGLQFSAALRISPDFAPAAFYLGACYAAAGRDREATTWWRRALLASETLPIEHASLADALFRLGNTPEALALLRGAVASWPDADPLRRRLAIAHALAREPVVAALSSRS